MNYSIKNTLTVIGFAAASLFAGCHKTIDDEITSLNFSQLFSPTAVSTTIVGGTSVVVTWAKVAKAETYDIEIFANKDFSGTPAQTAKNISASQLTYTFKGLYGETDYSLRIKAISQAVPESKWTVATFKSGAEQIMKRIERTDLTLTSVTVKWNNPNEVSHFMIGTNKYEISASEKTAGAKTITGLTNGTTYTAKLYFNNGVRGSRTFKTYAANPTGSNVYVISDTAVFRANLANAVGNAIFVIPQGATYSWGAGLTLPANAAVTFWGEDGAVRPVLAFNGITLPTTAGTIKFANLDLTGYANNNSGDTKRNYIFNQSAATTTEAIVFDNCIVRNFVNTPVRVQGSNAITVGKVAFNNCIVYDCGVTADGAGSYAVVSSNVATGKLTNIEFTQTTFYNIGYGLVVHSGASLTSLKMENCTMYNSIGNGRYIFDVNGQTVTTFTVRNNIIGKTLSPAASANGYRGSTAPTVTNSYITKDAVFAAGALPSIISYTNNSTDLFTDPASANFLIKDSLFAGASTAGDSRWMP